MSFRIRVLSITLNYFIAYSLFPHDVPGVMHLTLEANQYLPKSIQTNITPDTLHKIYQIETPQGLIAILGFGVGAWRQNRKEECTT